MKIWALSDPHLAFGVPAKTMEAFGPAWKGYAEKIADNWKRLVSPDDLVLIPGDISWAMRLDEAIADLKWIDALPGKKILLKGNHDYWWSSSSKMAQVMPPSIRFVQNNALNWNDVAIGGSRLWDTPEYSFNNYIIFQENPLAKKKTPEELSKEKEEEEKVFARELERLKLSLSQLDPKAKLRIALTHYPPIGPDLKPSKASEILEHFKIDICVFGHLHNVKQNSLSFGKARGVAYIFASCDYIDFTPMEVFSWP
ncbi:MAG: metallophosphoesterase [Verrucomicrobia bacterium]|nr:metallophosphoesterase [Verrucomicrobiota bacterium]